jgi:outer membrane immunogenic protein
VKKLGLGIIALATFTAGSAFAADKLVKAPVMVKPVFSWTGLYFGGNVGYGWRRGGTDVLPLPSAATFLNLLPQTLDPMPKGVFGGGQAGANWQIGTFVVGAEFDFQGTNIAGTFVESPIIQNNGTPFPGAFPGNNITISQKLNWFGTGRMRAGTTIVDPRLLLFVTAGVAYGKLADTGSVNFRPVGTTLYAGTDGSERLGLAVGAGTEWAVTDRWSIKAEYLHIDLGASSITVNADPLLPPFQVTYTSHTKVDMVRGGVNVKFFP